MRSLVLAFVLAGCAAAPSRYAPSGDPSYQTATVCTSADLAPLFEDATARWHDAAPRVRMSVRVVPNPERDYIDGCDAHAYEMSLKGYHPDLHPEANTLAMGGDGLIVVDASLHDNPDVSDTLTHELGHLLLGAPYGGADPSHSNDPKSVMYWVVEAGEQAITAREVELLP